MSEEKPSETAPSRFPTPQSGSRRVPPNPDAPRLRPKTEKRIAEADQKSAEAYDELDASREKINQLKEMIQGGEVQVILEIGDTAVHTLKDKVAGTPPASAAPPTKIEGS